MAAGAISVDTSPTALLSAPPVISHKVDDGCHGHSHSSWMMGENAMHDAIMGGTFLMAPAFYRGRPSLIGSDH